MTMFRNFIILALLAVTTNSHASILDEISPQDCKAIQDITGQFLSVFNGDTPEQVRQTAKDFNQKYPDFVPHPTSKRPVETYEFDFDGDGQADKVTVQNGLGTNMMAGAYKIYSSKTGETKDSLEMPAQMISYKSNYFLAYYNLIPHPKNPQRPFFEFLSLSRITADGIIPICEQQKTK